MTQHVTAAEARRAWRALDERLAGVDVDRARPPRGGWIRAIREALMLSGAGMGRRLGVSRQAVAALEKSEADGTIRLESLRRAAGALDCELVYALVPYTTLQGTIETQAGRIADALTADVAHTMTLEGQTVTPLPTDRADLIQDLIHNGQIWRV